MKQQRMLVGKFIAIPAMMIAACMLLFSFRAKQVYADFWQQLGIAKESGMNSIKESFLGGYLQYYGARNMKNIALGDRTAVTKDLLAYTKQYVESDAFKKVYSENRILQKPHEPNKPRTEEEIRTEQVSSLKKSQGELEKGMKTATSDMKKIFQESYDMITKQIKEYQDPNNAMIKMIAQSEQAQYEFNLKDYQQRTAEWENLYPTDSRGFVKKRLQQMLEDTQGVDYGAQLTERYNKKYFANPVYERKPANWKYAFRAGKEVTETARAFAQEWLRSL
ncbi:MAG: hypothetical protein QM731_06520 [Chitinophagaceae bacterium]